MGNDLIEHLALQTMPGEVLDRGDETEAGLGICIDDLGVNERLEVGVGVSDRPCGD